MHAEENNQQRREGAGRRVAALALALGALTAPAAATAPGGLAEGVVSSDGGASAMDAVRAQFERSFTPGAAEVPVAGSGDGKVHESQPGKIGS